MKVVYDSTTGRIHRAYADDNFACPLGPNEASYIFDNSTDPSDKKVDLSSSPDFVMINQDTFTLTATSGSIIGEQVSLGPSTDIVVDETISFTIQKINGETTANMTDPGDNDRVFVSLGDFSVGALATLDVELGDLGNGEFAFSLTAPSTPGSEELQILGDGLKAVSVILNYVSA